MAKEIYLYNPIYNFVAEAFIAQLQENMGEPVDARICSPGGSVYAAYGIYTKIKEHGNVNLKIDGNADSAASYLPFYAKSVECLDVSRFTFHRADMFVENEDDQKLLDGVNKDLKNQMLKKLDPVLWLEVTGISIDDMFNPETRKDITITGSQAKKIGLVQKVNKLTPELEKQIAAFNIKTIESKTDLNKNQNITMTKEELQTKYPAVFAEVKAIGVAEENDRVKACLVFLEADPKGVKAAIDGGKPLTQTQMSEFAMAMMKKGEVKNLENESTDPVVTKTDSKIPAADAEKAKKMEEFEKSLDAKLKVTA